MDGRPTRAAVRLGVSAAIVSATLAGPAVEASNFSGATGTTGCVWTAPVNMADDWRHTVSHQSLDSVTGNALLNAYFNVYNPLAVEMVGESLNANTDLVAYDEDYTTRCGINWDAAANNVWAFVSCDSTWASGRCDQHSLRVDLPDMLFQDANGRTGLAVHEIGHTLGLMHLNNPANDPNLAGAMYQFGPYKNVLSPHDIAHINANY